MKLLMGGSDLRKLQRVRTRLIGMGVACEIVHQLDYDEPSGLPSYPELWVRKDEDLDTAAIVLRRPGSVGTAWRA
jgi:hypothetical protein